MTNHPDQISSQVIGLAQRASQLKMAGKLEAAKATYQQALALDDALPELWFNYGNLLQKMGGRKAGKQPAGEQAFERAIAINNSFFQAHLNLANALRDRGEHSRAIAHYQQVISLQPNFALPYQNLGQLLINLKQPKPAAQVFAAWCRFAPQDPTPLNGLGVALQAQGDYERAIAAFEKARSLNPNRFDSLNNLGALLRMIKRPHDALPHLYKAVQLDPSSDLALSNLVHTLLGLGRVGEALSKTQQILEQHPRSASSHLMRGFALVQQARITSALESFEQAQSIDPSATVAVANALFTLLYRDDISGAEFVAEREKWVARLPGISQQRYEQWKGTREPGRRLKVGYLSGDLRSHPVAFFLEPILANHSAEQVETYCYDLSGVADATTTRLKGYAHHWRHCVGISDDACAQQIYEDTIDILIDLSGHTAGNRSGVLMRKPAPLQMLYIGYPGSTGLPTMDYVISDRLVSPVETDSLYSEKILPVEGSFWCFKPHEFAPQPSELPALQNGYITLGSFNHTPKFSDSTIRLWSRVLAAVPTAKLKLKALSLADEETCAHFRQQFVALGTDPSRLIFEGPTLKLEEFFQSYHTIDIALDPTPYNGGTTTCEALWMGIPVVALRGERFCARMSHSLLNNVGLGQLSVETEEAYVEGVRSLCHNTGYLQQIRSELRSRMAASPICNGKLASQALENAYRRAWQQFCNKEMSKL